MDSKVQEIDSASEEQGMDETSISECMNTQGGQLRHGKQIPVQATATGRRAVKSHGKRRQTPGHPGLKQSRHYLPIRNEPMGRRVHSLKENIQVGQQNAGKW